MNKVTPTAGKTSSPQTVAPEVSLAAAEARQSYLSDIALDASARVELAALFLTPQEYS
jgi:hypothetical protein